MGFTVLSIAEVEADDVIATLTKQSLNEGLDVIISTLDKDLMQLVQDPKVRLYNSRDNKFYNEQKVFEKFGVHPNQITELLGSCRRYFRWNPWYSQSWTKDCC